MTLADIERRAADKPEALAELSDALVFGEGPAHARLLLVGEAPGEEEDLSGRPFVGRAGQLLDRILESVGLERGDVYITNLVKYRPPGNRNPRPEEIEASAPILLDQIRAIGPQVIGTLGNVPTQWFLDTKDGITKLHGTWHRWHGIRVMPLYHPAYLLRNPSRERGGPKWQMWQAMKELKALMDELPERHEPLALDTARQQGLF